MIKWSSKWSWLKWIWLVACSLYKVLDYLHVCNISMVSLWWNIKFIHINRTIIWILLNVQRYGFNVCLKCSPDVINSIEHTMFQCQSTKELENCTGIILYKYVQSSCWKKLLKLTLKELIKFILNGFNSSYISYVQCHYHVS